MSDFVVTQIKASKEVIDAMINTDENSEWFGHVDLNCIVPTPADVYQGALGSKEREIYGDKAWDVWNSRNWGTNRNAFETTRKSDTSVYFETCWATPWNALYALSKRFPNEKILVRIAGETNGHFAGSYVLLDQQKYHDPKAPDRQDQKKLNQWASKVRNRRFA